MADEPENLVPHDLRRLLGIERTQLPQVALAKFVIADAVEPWPWRKGTNTS